MSFVGVKTHAFITKGKYVMKNLVKPITIVVCLALSGYAYGVSNSVSTEKIDTAAVETAAQDETVILHGIVKRLDDGMALYTKKDVYPLIGGEFEMIRDKEVNIIGKLVREGETQKLTVNRIQLKK